MKKQLLIILGIFPCFLSAQWNKIFTSNNQDLYDVQLLGADAYIVGHNSTFLKSVDSGKSWSKITPNIPLNIRSVHFIHPDTGFVIGENARILKTTNGGVNWTQKYVRTAAYGYDIKFQGNNAIAVGKNMLAVSSNDRGENWGVDTTFLSNKKLNSVCITPSGMCWAVGDSGYLISKHISKRRWNDLKFSTKVHLNHISNIGDSVLIVCGGMADSTAPSKYQNILLISYDSGKSWTQGTIPELRIINTAWFVNADTGFITGSNGLVCKVYQPFSQRGLQLPGTASTLNSITFLNKTGLLIGDGGLIYRTKNYGGFATSLPSTKTKSGLLFPNPSSGNIKITSPEKTYLIKIWDISGKNIPFDFSEDQSEIQLHSKGLFKIILYFEDGSILTETILIQG